MSKKAEGFSLRFVLINTGNISRKVLSKVLRSFDKNFERLHVGGLVYAVAVNRGRLEDLSTQQLMILVAVTLYHGFTSTGVDNAAHVGGLLIGIFLGMIFYRKPGKNKRCIYNAENKEW